MKKKREGDGSKHNAVTIGAFDVGVVVVVFVVVVGVVLLLLVAGCWG